MKLLPVALFVSAIAIAAAQDRPASAPPVEVYRADFQIRDEGAKPRKFSMLLETGGVNQIRIGNKVPIATALAPNGVPSQYSYVDTGMNVEARLRNSGGKLSLRLDLELTSVPAGERPAGSNPPMANVRTSIQTLVSLKKPIVVLSLEDPATTRKLEIEVTLTQVD